MSELEFFSYTDFTLNATNRSAQNLLISYQQSSKRTAAATAAATAAVTNGISHELNIPYTIFEILVAIVAIIGNLMVIIVFQRDRKLRRRTNYYIVSLAIADFLVGLLGVPFAILASIGLPTNLHACLFTVSLLVVLCTISIFCLVAVSVDRYWAILYPMAYSRNVRTKTAIGIISMCWVAGTIVGFLPLFGWHAEVGPNQDCLFVEVMDYSYLVFLYFATIITPALLMLAFYAHIYRVIVKQVRQIVTMNPVSDNRRRSSPIRIQITPVRLGHGGTMLRVLGAARKREVKATQNLSIIVLFFMICWIPLYTINCIKAFCPDCYVHPKLTFFCIILSHLNSAVNPILYAYHLKDFRAALKSLILKMFGMDVDPPLTHNNAMHRFSLASQHRLQSMDNKRSSSLQAKIYIDSPVWLRQQQQLAVKTSQIGKSDYNEICRMVTPIIANSLGSVAAVTPASTADTDTEMWNVSETMNTLEKDEIRDDKISSNQQQNKLSTVAEDHSSSFSYDNRTYHTNSDYFECDEVFLNKDDSLDGINFKNSIIISAKYRKHHHSDSDCHDIQQVLADSSSSIASVNSLTITITDGKNQIKSSENDSCRQVNSRSFSSTSESIAKEIKLIKINSKHSSPITIDSSTSNNSIGIVTNNNSNGINNLNYFGCQSNKLSPFQAMTELISMPNLIKHSSLFHILNASNELSMASRIKAQSRSSNDIIIKDSPKTENTNEQMAENLKKI